jgi:hypothetical protein
MAQPQPTGPFQKSEQAISLNYDELYDAGYSNYDIAKGIGQEVNKDVDAFLEMGGNVDDFLYVYSNAAEPGGMTTFMDRFMRGLTKSAPVVAGTIGGGIAGTAGGPLSPVTVPIGMAVGAYAGMKTGDDLVKAGEQAGIFETAPPLKQDRVFAVAGDILGEGVPMLFSLPYLVRGASSSAGILMSERLNNIAGVKGSVVRAPGRAYTGVENFLRGVGETARGERGKIAQRTLYGVEGGSLAASAVGGAIGQETLQGGQGGRFVGEVVGGFFEPRLLLARNLVKYASKAPTAVRGQLGTEGREARLGEKIRTLFEKYGENPDEIIRQLEEGPQQMQAVLNDLQMSLDLPPLTPAQITGSPVLRMFESQVANKSGASQIDQESLARAQKGYEFVEQVTQALMAQGDPDSVRLAIQIRADAIGGVIQQSLIKANANAQTTASRLGANQDFDVIGLNLKTQFDQIIKNANQQEERLWNEVPKDMTIPVEGFFDNVKEIQDKFFLTAEDFPANIATELRIMKGKVDEAAGADDPSDMAEVFGFELSPSFNPTGDAGEVSVATLTKLRSRALDAAREAMRAGDKGKAKALGELGNAILEQLDQVVEGGDPAYDMARAFSRGKNDALRRTFLGDIMARDRDGADVIEPSLIVGALFEGGADPTAIRFRQIQDGASFVQDELARLDVPDELRIPLGDLEFGPVSQASLDSALTQAVQLTAAKVINPSTGRIDPQRAAKFSEDYKVLLRSFPQVDAMLKDGKQFEDMVKLMEKNKSQYEKALKANTALGKVLRYESPVVAIAEGLGSTRPVDSLESIIGSVKKMSNPKYADALEAQGFTADEAMEGLKSSMVEWMWTKAGGSGDSFNFAAAKKAMFEPLQKGAPSTTSRVSRAQAEAGTTDAQAVAGQLRTQARQRQSVAEVLKREGVFTQAELDRLEYLLDQGAKIQTAVKRGGKATDDLIDEMGFMSDFLMRLGGAKFGTEAARTLGMQGQGLVAESAGVRLFRNNLQKTPAGNQLRMLEKAVLDPEFMIKLLKKSKSAEDAQKNAKFLNAYLINAGLALADEDDTSPGPDIEIETPLPQRPAGLDPYKLEDQVSMSSPQPPRVTTPAPLPATAPSVGTLAQAPSSPDTRAKMAAAFPSDGILGLMGRA